MHLNIAILHGIGRNELGYADALIKGIEKEFALRIQKMEGPGGAAAPKLNIRQIVWDDILNTNQGQLKTILERALEQKKRTGFLGFWTSAGLVPLIIAVICLTVFKQPVIFLFAFLAAGYLFYRFGSKFYFQLRTGFASQYVMDIIGYLDEGAKKLIQERIKAELKTINGDKEPVTLISHSLGTVIASDFVWDRQDKKDFGNFQLGNFFTMGSPIALFALRWGAELFNKPIRIDAPGCWINILDKDDPIAYPLKGLNKEYNAAVKEDKEVDAGLVGISHVKYWKNKDVHKIIAGKLAEDWVKGNK